MLTYTISVSIRSTLLRYSLFFSEYLSNHSNHSTCPDTRPDTINTRPRRRPSVQLETDRPGIEAGDTLLFSKFQLSHIFVFWIITSSLQELRCCQLVPKACKSACCRVRFCITLFVFCLPWC